LYVLGNNGVVHTNMGLEKQVW